MIHHRRVAPVEPGAADASLHPLEGTERVPGRHDVEVEVALGAALAHLIRDDIGSLVRDDALVGAHVDVDDSSVPLLEAVKVVELLAAVARPHPCVGASLISLARLSSAEAIGDKDCDGVGGGREVVVKRRKFRLVRVSFKVVELDVELAANFSRLCVELVEDDTGPSDPHLLVRPRSALAAVGGDEMRDRVLGLNAKKLGEYKSALFRVGLLFLAQLLTLPPKPCGQGDVLC